MSSVPVNHGEEGMNKRRCKYHILTGAVTEEQRRLFSEKNSCTCWDTKPASPHLKSVADWHDSSLTSINQSVMTNHPGHAVKQTGQGFVQEAG